MKIDVDDNQDLNADAIYAGMAWLKEYFESREGKAAYMDLLRRRHVRINEYECRLLMTGSGGLLSIPFLQITSPTIEGIYPGEAQSVWVGIELADSVLREPPDQVVMRMQDMGPDDPRIVALSRFISDRAN